MTRQEIIAYVQNRFSANAEYLWDGETHAVFRHPATKKWFGIIMEVKKSVLNIPSKNPCEMIDIMNVKLPPVLIEDLLHENEFLPAYHMNKKYWLSIKINDASEKIIKNLLEKSYDSVSPKMKKKNNAHCPSV